MDRIDQIIYNQKYKEYRIRIEKWEKDRIFCHHDTNHFLSVARIAWILNLEEQLHMEKEYIYAAALLHDIGRFKQYEDGSDHAVVSSELAVDILSETGFSETENKLICDAIASHRIKEVADERNLKGILYRADKLSRDCYFCKASDQCDWKNDKKNESLPY